MTHKVASRTARLRVSLPPYIMAPHAALIWLLAALVASSTAAATPSSPPQQHSSTPEPDAGVSTQAGADARFAEWVLDHGRVYPTPAARDHASRTWAANEAWAVAANARNRGTAVTHILSALGRGLHSFTFQLNLSRFSHNIHPKDPLNTSSTS